MKNFVTYFITMVLGLMMPLSLGKPNGYNTLTDALISGGLTIDQVSASGWVRFERKSENKQDVIHVADEILGFLDTNSDMKKEIVDESDNMAVIKCSNGTKIIQVSVDNECAKDKKNYCSITVDITRQDGDENIIDIRRRLENCLKLYDTDYHIYCSISAYKSGKADYNTKYDIINGIINKLNVKNPDSNEDGNIISLTGFCPYIDDYIMINASKVNINIACRYNSYEDKTFFLLGTPVIYSEY